MNVKPIGYSVYPNVIFTMESGNSEKYFDIKRQENVGNSGKFSLHLKSMIWTQYVYY